MAKVRVLTLRAPGTNCDEETLHAWRVAGAEPSLVRLDRFLHQPDMLREFQILTLPGGFSYGDDIAAGQVWAGALGGAIFDLILDWVERGGGVLGICNGFQVLVKSGLLPGRPWERRHVTVTHNRSGRFEARWVRLRGASDRCAFIPSGEVLELPVEHGEGRVVVDSPRTLHQLEAQHHIALHYVDDCGNPTESFPANPNGSAGAAAGLCDVTGRILGLMPHPERFLDPTHSPSWTRTDPRRPPDGLRIFQNAVHHWK